MNRYLVIQYAALAVLLFVILIGDAVLRAWSISARLYQDIVRWFYDSDTQWIAFLYSLVNFSVLSVIRWRRSGGIACLWISVTFLIGAAVYAFAYRASVSAVVLLSAAMIGYGIAVWRDITQNQRLGRLKMSSELESDRLVVNVLLVILVMAYLWKDNTHFAYLGQPRWAGPWDNPNAFGMLMGAGTVMGIGLIADVASLRSFWALATVGSQVFATILVADGLRHSWSRGAWLGTACGIGWFAVWAFSTRYWSPFKKQRSSFHGLAAIIIISTSALYVSWLAGMESGVARRVFSSVSYIDFSWRNRVAAWEGALQLMSGSGWLGYGWGQPQRFYSSYYLPEHIIEGGAFGLNDYLTLGATLGVPALLCFGMYIWLSLAGGGHKHLVKKPDGDKRGQISLASKDSGRIKAMCQSAAIVMLVGFWFDGGLFKLPTAALFWIVLELGKENSSVTSTERIAECHVKTASM